MKSPAPHLDPDAVSRSKAKLAARAALLEIVAPPRNTNRASSVALFTWGGLAVLSAAVATSIGLMPKQNAEPELVASLSQSHSDDVPDGASNIRFPDLPVAKVVSDEEKRNILAGRPELDATTTAAISPAEIKPEAKLSSQLVSGSNLGVDIGGSNSIPVLEARFLALQKRSPEMFDGLQPLVRFSEAKGQLDARLIAGPFASADQLATFCRSVRLQLTLDCKQTGYEGDPIKLSN